MLRKLKEKKKENDEQQPKLLNYSAIFSDIQH